MSREKQRANRRKKDREEKMAILNNFVKHGIVPVERKKEELLDLTDSFGLKDPTPYLAVKNIIRRERETITKVGMTV